MSRELLRKLSGIYQGFFQWIEGPEQEARIVHSHYLCRRAQDNYEKHIRGKITGDVLDVGAGAGYGSRLIDERAHYFPTDIETARDWQDSRITRRGIPLVKTCSVYAIDYEDNRFDACLALSLIEHLKEPERALAEIRRVVKPGGLLLVQAPFAFPVHGYPDDFWRWTEEGLKLFLESNGYELVDTQLNGKSIHVVVVFFNLYLRHNLFGFEADSGIGRRILYALARPVLLLVYLLTNLTALFLGLFERRTHSPLSISCLVRNTKS
jgi:SAM-dependent methyltransferase